MGFGSSDPEDPVAEKNKKRVSDSRRIAIEDAESQRQARAGLTGNQIRHDEALLAPKVGSSKLIG